jgi:group I intron endonuclease
MNSKSAGIYLIISKTNGKRYVGSAVRICKRWSQHISDLRLNKHHSQYLQNHYNKYGEDDLVFSILEVVERGELTLNDFKELLLSREQAYLDNWDECHFNCLKTAGSTLGYKHPGAKYYKYYKNADIYQTYFTVGGKDLTFSCHKEEEEAIKEVEYLKTLTDLEASEYYKICKDKQKDSFKWYTRENNKFRVTFKVEGKTKRFGEFYTEQEAIDRVKYLKTLNDLELSNFLKELRDKPQQAPINAKNYYYSIKKNRWIVQIRINGINKTSKCKTEQEAIDKVKQFKQELGNG